MRIILAILGAVTFFGLFMTLVTETHYDVYAPELFGEARMDMLRTGRYGLGIIHNDDLVFLVAAKGPSGRIVQIGGGRVDNYGNTAPIPFVIRESGNHFSGYIVFRGHARKFCSIDMVKKCLKR